jgi:hypothetical protein
VRLIRHRNCLVVARAHAFTPIFGRIRVVHLFWFLCCPMMCIYALSSVLWCPLRVPCCDVGYEFHIQTMLGSSLPPVICKAACLVFFIYAWLRILVPDTFCVVFLFCFVRLVYLVLPVSLGCTFVVLSLRYSLTFTNIYDIYIYFIIINSSSSSLVTENHQRLDVYFPAHAW